MYGVPLSQNQLLPSIKLREPRRTHGFLHMVLTFSEYHTNLRRMGMPGAGSQLQYLLTIPMPVTCEPSITRTAGEMCREPDTLPAQRLSIQLTVW